MKLLVDENLPRALKRDFPEHEVVTARDKGWNGKKNGELLQLLVSEEFDILLTFEKNIEYQQNFAKYPISVFQLDAVDNTYFEIRKLVPEIRKQLAGELKPGVTRISIPQT
jgi:predicted nuclease of predicted toxin-antitoxin system